MTPAPQPDSLEELQHIADLCVLRLPSDRAHGAEIFRDEIESLDATLSTIRQAREADRARIAELEECERDIQASYERILFEACTVEAPDNSDRRVHCTCVPVLRRGVKELTAEREALRARVAELGGRESLAMRFGMTWVMARAWRNNEQGDAVPNGPDEYRRPISEAAYLQAWDEWAALAAREGGG